MRRIQRNKKKAVVVISVSCITVMALMVFAKFYKDYYSSVKSSKVNIADFYIDLVNEDKENVITKQIGVSNLNPGETRKVVFFVRNGYKDTEGRIIKSDVDIKYNMELIHTENLPLKYKLYNEDNKEVSHTVKENAGGKGKYLNMGKSISYKNSGKETDFCIYTEKGKDITYNKYTLEITWDKSENDSKYVKELDMLYLIVTAVQSKPQ